MSSQQRSPRIAFQGERGAFSEEAAVGLLGEAIEVVPRPTFEALFTAVDDGVADQVLAPIENTLAGSVHRSYDLLLESKLAIAAEVVIRISHHLIGPPGASVEGVKVVESHPVALAQCERFFAAHRGLKRVATEDTAGSVRQVVEAGDPSRAAIAGQRAAAIYGGTILREHIEDHRHNYTRFLLLAPSPGIPDGANKLSLVMKLAHRPGTLHRALGVFAERNLNLSKIESRPVPGRPWEYRFYLDVQASIPEADTVPALVELREHVEELRVLGCYVGAAIGDKASESS